MRDAHEIAPVLNQAGAGERPLRVAVFAHEFPALSETFVLGHITGLIDHGNDVTVFATGPRPDDPSVHADFRRYRLDQRLRYRAMPRSRARRALSASGILLRRRLAPPMLRALDALRYRRDAASLSLLHWADCLLDQPPFDIIHCHFGQVGRNVAFLREIGAIRGRLVVMFHGVDVTAFLDQNPELYRHLFATGDLFLPVSAHFQRRLVRHGCDPERTKVHHLGVDLARFPYRPRQPRADRPFTVLTIARLVEKKGVVLGLQAVARLARAGVPIRYAVVGDGPLRGVLEAAVRDLGIGAQATFHGWKTQDEIVALMQGVDALLFPSITGANGDQEGSPVVLKEAMATGLPIIASRHAGIDEIVDHGVSGFLVAERDAGGMADALHALLRDPELCARIGAAARSKVAAEFDIDRLNRQLQQYYRSLLERQRHARAERRDGFPPKGNADAEPANLGRDQG
ncbi:MAG: glycosyltransferase [Alphaproteobacteria bacterium]|nr:glycosyltransferase [Alphaproteobacteria bacterium]